MTIFICIKQGRIKPKVPTKRKKSALTQYALNICECANLYDLLTLNIHFVKSQYQKVKKKYQIVFFEVIFLYL